VSDRHIVRPAIAKSGYNGGQWSASLGVAPNVSWRLTRDPSFARRPLPLYPPSSTDLEHRFSARPRARKTTRCDAKHDCRCSRAQISRQASRIRLRHPIAECWKRRLISVARSTTSTRFVSGLGIDRGGAAGCSPTRCGAVPLDKGSERLRLIAEAVTIRATSARRPSVCAPTRAIKRQAFDVEDVIFSIACVQTTARFRRPISACHENGTTGDAKSSQRHDARSIVNCRSPGSSHVLPKHGWRVPTPAGKKRDTARPLLTGRSATRRLPLQVVSGRRPHCRPTWVKDYWGKDLKRISYAIISTNFGRLFSATPTVGPEAFKPTTSTGARERRQDWATGSFPAVKDKLRWCSEEFPLASGYAGRRPQTGLYNSGPRLRRAFNSPTTSRREQQIFFRPNTSHHQFFDVHRARPPPVCRRARNWKSWESVRRQGTAQCSRPCTQSVGRSPRNGARHLLEGMRLLKYADPRSAP